MNISAELADVASYGGFFAISIGGEDAGWHPVQRYYSTGFDDLVDATVRRYRTTDRRIGASLVQFSLASRLWSPMLACALAHGVVPDLAELQRADGGSALRLPHTVAQPAEPSPESLYRTVVEEHLDVLAAGLRVKMARGLLLGNAASALIEAARALITVRPDLRARALDLVESLLATKDLTNTGVLAGSHLEFKRRSCCLYYRVAGSAKCRDCALR